MKGAKQLAKEFRRAADAHPGNETAFRAEAERTLDRVARQHGVSLEPKLAVTLATGQADAVFNRMVVEWEPPGGMGPARGHPGNRHAVGQVRRYVQGLAAKERREVERLSGVACDGHWMIFCRYRAGRWIVDDPVEVDESSAAQLLRSLLAAQGGRALTAENLLGSFSGDAHLTKQLTRALLDQLDAQVGQSPDGLPARLFRQWETLFAVATGVTGEGKPLEAKARRALERVAGAKKGADPSRVLFCLQTYFSIVTKLIASLSLSFWIEGAEWDLEELAEGGDDELLEDMQWLQRGTPFAEAGLPNAIEPDVFGWYLLDWRPAVRDGTREVVKQLKEYDPTTLWVSPEDTRDLLKDLYQGLLPRPLRHALGQYFTPDWLAEMLLNRLSYESDSDSRLVDPACGTGTFLVLAISRLREQLRREGASSRVSLETIVRNVVGFDIDPLAALAARTNYVLALGPLVGAAKGRPLDIPVYRADSMIAPTLKALHAGDRLVLETEAGEFALPPCVDTDEELRRVCDLAVKGLEEGWDSDSYSQRAGRVCAAKVGERRILAEFFERCREMHSRELDGLWPRLLRNAFMPAFIGRFDLVVGNPPWVNWEHLPGSYRTRTRAVWEESGLFVHGGMASMLGSGKKDVSMLMSYVATDRLLNPRGRLGFVLPETLFKTAGAGQGFRSFRIGRDGPSLKVEGVDDMVDLSPFVGAANRTALMTWRRGRPTRYPVPYRVWQRTEARGIPEQSTVDEVQKATRLLKLAAAPVSPADDTSAWLAAPSDLIPALRKLTETGDPAYRAHAGVYAGVNGVYWVSVEGKPDAKGRVPIANLHDIGKREVPKRYGRVEAELVHPLVRGSDVRRWRAQPSAHILFVQDPATRVGIDEATMRDKYPEALKFLEQFEEILRSRRGLRSVLGDADDSRAGGPFWSMFGVGPYTLSKHKVVWKDQATDFAAAVLGRAPGESLPLPNHKVILVDCSTKAEAHFLCGALNSAPARAFIASYSVETAIATHPIKYIRVPTFDPEDSVHARLAKASQEAHARVRAGKPPNEAAVDKVAAKLWGLSASDVTQLGAFLDQLLKRDLKQLPSA